MQFNILVLYRSHIPYKSCETGIAGKYIYHLLKVNVLLKGNVKWLEKRLMEHRQVPENR